MTPALTVAETPVGTHPHSLSRLADQDLRTVFFVARPGHDDRVEADLLGGLCARDDVAGAGRDRSSDDAARAVIWLAAHRTRTVVCSSPQVLSDGALDRLARHVAAAGTDLLLACDHRHARPTADRLAHRDPAVVPWDRAVAGLPPARRHDPFTASPDPVEWDGLVSVPRTDFTTFRADCRRLLPPAEFARVDRLYVETARRVHGRPDEPSVEQVVDDLASDLDQCTALDDAVTVLRATQAGLFKRGWALTADLDRTVSRLCSPERALPLTDSEWRLLRGYATPHRAAVCALNAADTPNSGIKALAVADAADDGPLLAGLPPQAVPYVRAQRLSRLANGAAPDEPLFTEAPSAISAILRDARRDLGLRLANRLVDGSERNVRTRGHLGLSLYDMRTRQDAP